MVKNIHATTTEVAASHVARVSQPDAIVIDRASE